MRKISKKKLLVAGVATAVIATGGGVALAYWSSTGTGSGSATTGTSTDFVVTSDAATGGPLTPGGPSQTVAFHIKNPGTGNEKLTSVVAEVAKADGSDWSVTTDGLTCSAADYTVDTPNINYGEIPPNTTVDGTVTITMNDLASNQDACQGVTVPLYFSAS